MSFTRIMKEFREKYHRWLIYLTALIILGLLTAKEIFPILNETLQEKGVISGIILIFLVDVVNSLFIIEMELKESRQPYIYQTQAQAMHERIIKYINERKPKKVDMIYYSAYTALDLIDILKSVNCRIRLLIQHPENAEGEFQRGIIQTQIRALSDIRLKDYDNAEIKVYTRFPSIRGSKFDDDLIDVGWYTPAEEKKGWLRGHDNPEIICSTKDESGRILGIMFDNVFKYLWKESDSIDKVMNETLHTH